MAPSVSSYGLIGPVCYRTVYSGTESGQEYAARINELGVPDRVRINRFEDESYPARSVQIEAQPYVNPNFSLPDTDRTPG